MKSSFEVAAGTIVGHDHVRVGRNNQDAHAIIQTDTATIAVVCDGCGSGRYSEVGSLLGAQIVCSEMVRASDMFADNKEFWDGVLLRTVSRVDMFRRAIAGERSLSEILNDYFLFTIIGVWITPMTTRVFGIGDGVYAINGTIVRIGPFPGNAPPYVAYRLTNTALLDIDPDLLAFTIYESISTECVESVLVGSDGVVDLIGVVDRMVPGGRGVVGPMNQFWENDQFFSNPFALDRRLRIINPSAPKVLLQNGEVVMESGLLPDDTTMVSVRRRAQRA